MKRRLFLVITLMAFFALTITKAYAQPPGSGRGPLTVRPNRSDMPYRPNMGRYPDKKMEREFRIREMDRCLDELNLSPEQLTDVDKIRKEHREKIDKINEEMENYRKSMIELESKKDADQETIEEVVSRGVKAWKEGQLERITYRKSLSGILTQEQMESLGKCEDSINMKMMRHRPGPYPFPERD